MDQQVVGRRGDDEELSDVEVPLTGTPDVVRRPIPTKQIPPPYGGPSFTIVSLAACIVMLCGVSVVQLQLLRECQSRSASGPSTNHATAALAAPVGAASTMPTGAMTIDPTTSLPPNAARIHRTIAPTTSLPPTAPLIQHNGSASKTNVSRARIEETNDQWKCLQHQVVYNRLPKAGSESIMRLLDILGSKNKFTVLHGRGFMPDYIAQPKQHRLLKKGDWMHPNWTSKCLTNERKNSWVYVNHIRYVDFPYFYPGGGVAGNCRPRLINVMRNPVGAAISGYYFLTLLCRNNSLCSRVVTKIPGSAGDQLYQHRVDINECVEVHAGLRKKGSNISDPEYKACLLHFLHFGQSLWEYLCGFHPDCEGTEWRAPLHPLEAYARARSNARNYAVIGLVEEMDKTLEVLEHMFPQLFRGARNHYTATHHHNNMFYVRPNERVSAWLKKNLSGTLDLYYFLRQRFYRQYELTKASAPSQNSRLILPCP